MITKSTLFMMAALLLAMNVQAKLDAKAWTTEELGAIPFDDGLDENGNLDEQAKDFQKNWRGKRITMTMGGIKLSENYAYCSPKLKGTRPETIVQGTLVSRPRGGSGGNSIELKDCKMIRK